MTGQRKRPLTVDRGPPSCAQRRQRFGRIRPMEDERPPLWRRLLTCTRSSA